MITISCYVAGDNIYFPAVIAVSKGVKNKLFTVTVTQLVIL